MFAKSSVAHCLLYFLTAMESTRGFNQSLSVYRHSDTVISLHSEGDVLFADCS